MKREQRAGGGDIWQDHTVVCNPPLCSAVHRGKYRPWQRLGGDGAAQTQDEIMNVPNKSEWTGERARKREQDR